MDSVTVNNRAVLQYKYRLYALAKRRTYIMRVYDNYFKKLKMIGGMKY